MSLSKELSKEEKLERPVQDLKDVWTGSRQAWAAFLKLAEKYHLEKISDLVILNNRKISLMYGFGKGTQDRLQETLEKIDLSLDIQKEQKIDYS